MFIRLTDRVSVAGQIAPADIAAAVAAGFIHVVNNRPDGEAWDQPDGRTIAAACVEAGIGYDAIPVDHAGFSPALIEAMAAVLHGATGPVLAFCRSGSRSAHLWALAEVARGAADPDSVVAAAASGRYDVSALLPALHRLAHR